MGKKFLVPLGPDVHRKFHDYYTNPKTLSVRSSGVRKLLELFNADIWPKDAPATILCISSMPIQRLIDCVNSISDTHAQKCMLFLIVTLARFEEFDEIDDSDEYAILIEQVVAKNLIYRQSITLAQTTQLRWPDIVRLSTVCIDGLLAYNSESIKYCNELNTLLLITMIRDMPPLRMSEYRNIMLKQDDTTNNNYIEVVDDIDNPDNKIWTLVIRTHKMMYYSGDRRIPISKSVVELLDRYKDKIWNGNLYLLRKPGDDRIHPSTMNGIIKEVYNDEHMSTGKLRILSASYYHDIYTEEEQKMLAYYMGHTFECHLIDYVRQ